MTKIELARLIEDFVMDSPHLNSWAWDDFVSIKQRCPELEAIRLEVLNVQDKFPSKDGMWCSLKGQKVLLEVAKRIIL